MFVGAFKKIAEGGDEYQRLVENYGVQKKKKSFDQLV